MTPMERRRALMHVPPRRNQQRPTPEQLERDDEQVKLLERLVGSRERATT